MKTITVTAADRTLFHVAAAQLGDPLAAIRLAQLSRISDPWLTGLQTVTVPDNAGPDTGGLPAPGTPAP